MSKASEPQHRNAHVKILFYKAVAVSFLLCKLRSDSFFLPVPNVQCSIIRVGIIAYSIVFVTAACADDVEASTRRPILPVSPGRSHSREPTREKSPEKITFESLRRRRLIQPYKTARQMNIERIGILRVRNNLMRNDTFVP